MIDRRIVVPRTEAIWNHRGFRRSLMGLMLFSILLGPRPAGAQSAVPHFAAGAGFITGFYILNVGGQSARYSINFHDDTGQPIALSFSGLGTRTTLSDTLPGNGSKYYEADSPSGDLLAGAGIITADPAFPGLGVNGDARGQYTVKDGRLLLNYIDVHGATIARTCQYGVDLGHFHLDCGSGTVSTLHTKPDLSW